MVYLREGINEYGHPTSLFLCDACGDQFTVCPSVPIEKRQEWNYCLAEGCKSYDPDRDADLLFMPDEEIKKEKKLISFSLLRVRRGK